MEPSANAAILYNSAMFSPVSEVSIWNLQMG